MRRTVIKNSRHSKSERGAALVTTLLISALLLTAGGMLILTTSMAGTGTIDMAAEMQAYYGAEAGLQATLNVLRGNVSPNPLFAANPPGAVDPQNRIDFRKAYTRNTSNLAGDPNTTPIRLSRWINYTYTPPGLGYSDRVAISPGYTPFTGTAYSISLDDPDDVPAPRPIRRLVVQSTGYGPRGARKTLWMLVSANGLDIDIPAPLVIRGHDNAVADAIIDLGDSNAKTYSGVDNAGVEPAKPTLAISGHDTDVFEAAYGSKPNTVAGDPKYNVLDIATDPGPLGAVKVKPPWFLETANAARAFVAQAIALANSCAAPAAPGNPCPKRGVILNSLNGSAGAPGAPQFTIVNGDCTLTGGAGLLIVRGTLFFQGPGPNFDGVILVLGDGRLLKQGGGNRDIFGSIMVARFGAAGGFLAPTFDYNGGGGNTNIQYDSRAVLDAIVIPGAIVLGVVEK